MLTRPLILAMMVGSAWTSQVSAAAHAEPVAQSKPAVANDNVPRLVDTKSEKTAEATQAVVKREPAKVSAPSSALPSERAGAKQQTQPRPKMKSAVKSPRTIKSKAAMRTDAAAMRKPATTHKPKRYVRERERGLDTAAIYAPKAIARLRRKRMIERAETSPESRASGWRYYVDTYAKGR